MTPDDVTATSRRDWAKAIRDLAMGTACPVHRCAARPGECCVASGESQYDYNLSRLDKALREANPVMRRRWRAVL